MKINVIRSDGNEKMIVLRGAIVVRDQMCPSAELAQSVERTTLNRVVVGSIPTFGELVVSDIV